MSTVFKNPAVILLAVLTLLGAGVYVYQLAMGLGVTGMNNSNSWGLYLTAFMFFVGLSAGGLIVASSASVFHVEAYKAVALPAVICSLVCICAAGVCVLVDLGGIVRLWRIITGPNLTSPLVWDVCVIILYIILNLLYLSFMVGKKADPAKVQKVSWVALPVAILVHSVTAWIFGLEIAREAWHTAILAPIFVASAMDSGLALLMLVLFGLKAKGVFDTPKPLFTSLAGLLCAFVAVDFYFIFCEILTTAYNGTEAGNAVLGTLLTGATAPFFWFEVVCGLVIPFVILVRAKNRESMKLIGAASVLICLGVLCKRVWLMFTGFATPNIIGAQGITLGTAAAQTGNATTVWSLMGTYGPTLPEVVITVGIFAAAGLALVVMCSTLLKKAKA